MGTIRIKLTETGYRMWREERVGKGGFRVVHSSVVDKVLPEQPLVEDATFNPTIKPAGK